MLNLGQLNTIKAYIEHGQFEALDEYLTQVYWNRFLGCKLTKHKVTIINDDNDVKRNFCFKCYRDVSPQSK